jgi:hypothetical protein
MRVTTCLSRSRAKIATSMCGAWGNPSGHGARFDRYELVPSLSVGLAATEAGKAFLKGKLVPVIFRVCVAAVAVRLPDLHHSIGGGLARAVAHRAFDPDGLRVIECDESQPVLLGEGEVKEGTDSLRGRGL